MNDGKLSPAKPVLTKPVPLSQTIGFLDMVGLANKGMSEWHMSGFHAKERD